MARDNAVRANLTSCMCHHQQQWYGFDAAHSSRGPDPKLNEPRRPRPNNASLITSDFVHVVAFSRFRVSYFRKCALARRPRLGPDRQAFLATPPFAAVYWLQQQVPGHPPMPCPARPLSRARARCSGSIVASRTLRNVVIGKVHTSQQPLGCRDRPPRGSPADRPLA
jgi:hypothetical protein